MIYVTSDLIISQIPVPPSPAPSSWELFNQFLYKNQARVLPSYFGDVPHRVKTILPLLYTLFLVVCRSSMAGSPPSFAGVILCGFFYCNHSMSALKLSGHTCGQNIPKWEFFVLGPSKHSRATTKRFLAIKRD